ncbi:hypothetical protein JC221_206 [Yersinia phage JC221]|nr:hypothetical protein JC221_206 [Yersinia phage JC221]
MISALLDRLFPSRVKARVERENRFQESLDLLEEIRFQRFLEDKKRREDLKHPNSVVAEGVSKCRIGVHWNNADYVSLVTAITPGVSLETLSRATGRSYIGIISRLRILKLVRRDAGFKDIWKSHIRKPSYTVFTADGKRVNIKELLISVGYIDKGSHLICPEWLSEKEIK